MRPFNRTTLDYLLLFLTVTCCSSLAGCTSNKGAEGSAPQTVVIVCVDRSDATASIREDQLRNLDSFEKSATESAYSFDLWAYDQSAVRLWGPDVPTAEDQTEDIETKELVVHKGQPKRGAALASSLLMSLANDPKLVRFPNARVVITTSPNSAMDDLRSAQLASTTLAKRSGWRIAVIGVGNANEAAWRNALGAFGNRADLTPLDQANSLLRQNRDE